MRLVPHIRTRRWVWLAVTAVLSAVWVGSMRWGVEWNRAGQGLETLGLGEGCLYYVWTSRGTRMLAPKEGLSVRDGAGWRVAWWPRFASVWGVGTGRVPLWIPVVGAGGVALLAFRRVRRLRAPGVCAECGYSMKGLAAGAKCPECGGK